MQGMRRNRTWLPSSTMAIYTTEHTGLSTQEKNCLCGMENNMQKILGFQSSSHQVGISGILL